MGLGKTYSADYLIDSNGNGGVSGQVLISTATGIDWSDGSSIIGGPFLPLAGGRMAATSKIEFFNGTQFIQASDAVDLKLGAADDIILESNFIRFLSGVEYARISGGTSWLANGSGSKLGIGTTAPVNKIQANYAPVAIASLTANVGTASTNWNRNAFLMGTGATVSNALAFGVSGTANDRKTWIQAGHPDSAANSLGTISLNPLGGNVGIGTTSPGQKLSVQGDSTAAAGRFTAGGNTNTLELFGNSTTGQSSGLLVNAGTNTADYAARFRNAAGSVMMNIRGDGNVGIGTTSPAGKLSVEGTGAGGLPTFDVINTSASTFNHSAELMTPNMTDEQNNILVLGRASSTKNAGYIGWKYKGGAGSNENILTFGHWGSDNLMNLDGIGNLGIGTETPDQKLDVDGNIRIPNAGKIVFGSSGTTPEDYLELNDVNASGSLLKLVQDNSVKFVVQGATGNVGIGTTNPGSGLSIGGTTGSYTSGIGFQPTGTGAKIYRTFIGTDGSFRFDDATVGATRLTINSSGNVGIGTTSPDALLNIESPNVDTAIIRLGCSRDADYAVGNIIGSVDFFSADTSGPGAVVRGSVSLKVETVPGADMGLAFSTYNNTERMRIAATGNVGIGTTSPTHLLTLETDSSPGLKIKDTTQGTTLLAFSQDANSHVGTYSSHPLVLDTNSTERMRIDSAGDVGIGKTSSLGSHRLSILKASNQQLGLYYDETHLVAIGAKSTGDAQIYAWNGSSYRNILLGMDGNAVGGSVGIGTASPSQKLHVAGNARVTGAFYDSNNSPGTLSGTELDKQLSIKLNEDGVLVGTKWKEIVFTPDIWEVNNGIFTGATTLVCDTVRAYQGNTNTTGSGASAGEIRIVDPGVYEITYSVAIQVGSTSITVRQNPALYLTAHPVDGTEISIPGSVNSVYLRLPNNNQGGRTSFANTCYYEVPANTDIALKLDWLNGAQSVEIYKAFGIENTISIRKISDAQTGGE